MRLHFFALALWMLGSGLSAQNLIRNPGLELVDPNYSLPIPDTFDLHNITGWYNPTPYGTPDYFNSDGQHPQCGSRFFAREVKARTGNGYVGIYVDKTAWREHTGVMLTDSLKGGQNYRFSMWMRISAKSRYAMSTMQLEFWDTTFVKRGEGYGQKFSPVSIRRTNQSSMVQTWTKVSVDFTAVGGERSFIIGYMLPQFVTTSMPVTSKNQGNDPYCYYYFDDLELVPIAGGPIPRKTDVRPIIYFDTDKDVIKKEFFVPLDSVVDKLKADATLKVQVNGFTDSVGNVEANLDLSVRRAEAVKKYLVDRGIAASRITTAGFAESRPAGTENAENRRVEFVFKQ
ncbi:MAG TPA: OmpA family protein [Bacteroidia bacterium]|nr:OmpA family protein [Bacteroidia bacterium]